MAKPLDNIRDPVGILALLVEACERNEANLRPYLDAGHDAVKYANEHLIIIFPENIIIGDSSYLADIFKNKPSPYELYKQTGGGKPYINAMIEHGYVIRKQGKDHK